MFYIEYLWRNKCCKAGRARIKLHLKVWYPCWTASWSCHHWGELSTYTCSETDKNELNANMESAEHVSLPKTPKLGDKFQICTSCWHSWQPKASSSLFPRTDPYYFLLPLQEVRNAKNKQKRWIRSRFTNLINFLINLSLQEFLNPSIISRLQC